MKVAFQMEAGVKVLQCTVVSAFQFLAGFRQDKSCSLPTTLVCYKLRYTIMPLLTLLWL